MSERPSARPADELLAKLRKGKRRLHAQQRALPLEEKIRRVIELQRFTLPLIAKCRPLAYHERAWPMDEKKT
jgi:hypothetical protein